MTMITGIDQCIVGSNVGDVDSGAIYGVAVFAVTTGVETWEYNLNDGSGWTSMEGGVIEC